MKIKEYFYPLLEDIKAEIKKYRTWNDYYRFEEWRPLSSRIDNLYLRNDDKIVKLRMFVEKCLIGLLVWNVILTGGVVFLLLLATGIVGN